MSTPHHGPSLHGPRHRHHARPSRRHATAQHGGRGRGTRRRGRRVAAVLAPLVLAGSIAGALSAVHGASASRARSGSAEQQGQPQPAAATASTAVSLWPSTARPTMPADPESRSVEVGTRFSTSVAGTVTAIRYYRHPSNAGPHTGHLWDDHGRLLATVDFSAETAAGWQSARLAQPVTLQAGRSYVVSYRAPAGHYADDQYFFANRTLRSGPLQADAGVYTYSTTWAYPTRQWRYSAYYADLAFVPSAALAPSPSPSPGPTVGPISPTPSSTTPAPAPSTTAPSSTPPPTSSAPAPPTGDWPSASSTGFQHTGVSLSPFACAGSVTEITTPGTVIDGKDIGCGILINADNVTISRSRVTTGADIAIRTADGRRGAKITDTEIVGQPGCIAGIGYEGWTALRVNIHGCGDGVRIETGSTLQDSWVHDFWDGLKNGVRIDTPHNDGAQSTGGSNMTIRHNRIDNPHSQTSCLLIGGEFGSPSNVLIESNYLNGGNFSIYLDPKGSNRVIRNNVFTRNYVYGPTVLDGQYVWEDNAYEDGTPIVR